MAAQVLSGTGEVSYTNSTGQNVRLVINYLKLGGLQAQECTVTFGGVSLKLGGDQTFGKYLAFSTPSAGNRYNSSMKSKGAGTENKGEMPMEIALANGDTFAITKGSLAVTEIEGYNIIIIPEAG